jgi:sucrose-6-phosphate hydrolase SacC (GH32 family)
MHSIFKFDYLIRIGFFVGAFPLAFGLTGCGGDGEGINKDSSVDLIILEEGQTVDDVIGLRSSSSTSSVDSSNVVITDEPATEGKRLFVRSTDEAQNISGFEFCCGQYDTYQEHEFTLATGDFAQLDGGFWAGDIIGAVGERVFSSFGDGYDDDADTTAAQIGPGATGSIMSPSFVIDTSYINFLVGGGANRFDAANATAVVLVIDGVVVRQSHGKNLDMAVAWDTWDVTDLAGQTAAIQFIDFHPDDNSDTAVPYILADEFRAADKAAVVPAVDSRVPTSALVIAPAPETAGTALFHRLNNAEQHIAGFEFCCGGYDTYQNHSFLASGDFLRFDGGQWAGDIINKLGDRVFASYGQGFADAQDTTGTYYGWEATGKLHTPTFTITSPYINFLAGGGTNRFDGENATAVVLRVNGKIVRHATGNGLEAELSWVTWDVSGLMGQVAAIEIIDAHDNSNDDGSFPFILLDEFRQATSAAANPAEDSVISAATGHEQPLVLDLGDPNPFYKEGVYYIYYLQNSGFHPWYLVKTDDLLSSTYPQEVIRASGDAAARDRWVGSGSVLQDQNGEHHLFYTGHNTSISPVEAVMHATATDKTLANWTLQTANTFSGSSGYSDYDFRDPLVFWNETAQKYWMLITSRYMSQAAIGLYTSDDLNSWAAAAPLYTEVSPLNLEVPDYFSLQGTPFIVYSDQRDSARQVKYLQQSGAIWTKPAYDALDGKAFYAARTAGSAEERLLFGWVAHKNGRNNSGGSVWGGDLMVHQVHKLDNGELVVALPEKMRTGLATPAELTRAIAEGVTDNLSAIDLTPNGRFTLTELAEKNRLSLRVTSANANASFGIQLRHADSGELAMINIDAANNQASFYLDGDASNPDNPVVSVPLDTLDGVEIEILLDPAVGVGAVYMNNYRALSFRLYGLSDYQVGVYSTADAISVADLARFTQ